LVKPNSTHAGVVEFLENQPKINAELNQKTRRSANFAVLVLRNEDKAEAKRFFQTPLLFSVQEAKGLEYENIILYNVISNYDKEFRELTNGVSVDDLRVENIKFSRGKDKSDKSLDEFKFYVNALYVGMTRAVKNLYVVESNKKHELLQLLGLTNFKQQTSLKDQASSQEEWQREARRLEMQGKQEQADAIRRQILNVQPVPWEVTTRVKLHDVISQALNPDSFNKKAKDRLFEYALYYNETSYFGKLASLKYRPAERWEQEGKGILKRMFSEYVADNLKLLQPKLQRYGVDFRNELNLTPFMLAINYGADNILKYLAENGANTHLTDSYGRNALQIVMLKVYADATLKAKTINRLYALLKGDAIRVKVDNRLIKVDSHQAEFVMLNFMLAVLRPHLIKGTTHKRWYYGADQDMPTFQTKDFLSFYEGLSEQVIPEYRRKRAYLSSILGKNEVLGTDKYNKKLFVRLRQGHYLLNPTLEILIDDDWVNVYDLIDLEDIIDNHAVTATGFLQQIHHHRQRLKKDPNAVFDQTAFWRELYKEMNQKEQ
jgi:ankyrin repeat protein